MTEDELTLSNPLIKAIGNRWETERKNRHTKQKLSFEELFECIKNAMSIQEICKKAGVTSQRFYQIYTRYFKEVLGPVEQITEKCRVNKKKKAHEDQLKTNPVLEKIFREAEKHDCLTEVVPHKLKGKPLTGVCTSTILVNKHRCSVHTSASGFKSRNRMYARILITYNCLLGTEVIVFLVKIPDFEEHLFIVPCEVLREAFFKKQSPCRKTVYLPLKKLPTYRNHRPHIDWWQYKDAWHLLLDKQQEAI